MGKAINPEQHVTFTDGRGYPHIMLALNEEELTEQLGQKPDRDFLVQNTADKSKLGKSWEPNSKMVSEETENISFFEISEEMTKNIAVLFSSGDQGLVDKANEFTTTLNKLNKELAIYNETKERAEKAYRQLQSELSNKPQENAAKIKAHENEFKELPSKLKDLEERFQALREQVATTRRPVMGLRPD